MSDDLIEAEGDVSGEVGRYMSSDQGALHVFLSDGTLLQISYGKTAGAIWKIEVVHIGSLFERIDWCFDENDDIYSDIAHFRDGLEWGYVTRKLLAEKFS
jgi:hypothetical protein